jgi:hypothetical protein
MTHSPHLNGPINLKKQPIKVQLARINQVKAKIKLAASRRIPRSRYKKNISWEDAKKVLRRKFAKDQ